MYVKETLKTFVQHNKFAVERDGIRAVVQTLIPEELFRWLPLRLSLCRCEKHPSSTRYSSDLLEEPSTSTQSGRSSSCTSSGRGSIFDPEVDAGELSDDTKASVEGLLEKSRHLRQHADSLVAAANSEVETSRVSKEIRLLGEGNPRPKQVTNLINTASPALKFAITGALVEDPDIQYLVNHPDYTEAGLDALSSLRDKFAAVKTRREKIHTICQRVGHHRDTSEPEVPRYSAVELAENLPGFDSAIDAFTNKLQTLETSATIQLLRRQPNFKGSYYANQTRAIRHLCYVKEACDKHGAEFEEAVTHLLETPVESLGFQPAYLETALERVEAYRPKPRQVELVTDSDDDDVLIVNDDASSSEFLDALEF